MGKFPINAIIFSFLIAVTGFVCFNYRANTKDNHKTSPDIFINHTTNDEISENSEIESAPASIAFPKTKKYILQYDGNEVILTTYYENGKENSSPIPDINIDYLTQIDREHLIDGIELERKEDVFKLIEDFSS